MLVRLPGVAALTLMRHRTQTSTSGSVRLATKRCPLSLQRIVLRKLSSVPMLHCITPNAVSVQHIRYAVINSQNPVADRVSALSRSMDVFFGI